MSAGDLGHRIGEATLALTDLEEAFKIASTVLVGPPNIDESAVRRQKRTLSRRQSAGGPSVTPLLLRAQILNFSEDYEGAAALAMEARRLRPPSVSAKKNALDALAWRGNGRIYDQPQRALDDYRNVLAGFEELRRWDPNNRLWQRERAAAQLVVSEGMVACHESKTKDCKPMPSLEEAEATSLEAIATLRALAEIDQTNFSLQRDLAASWALQDRARVLASQDRKAERLASIEEAEEFSSARSPTRGRGICWRHSVYS